ncbi:MAG: FGGY-family carbohydrate kinase [Christensenella sp.]|uniref:FGGY-family carbohydrate kinase n=1 Tax=Christensenella sp. TaxID=1935934 RepID=UPI002B2028DC|nr:FGGY-family carbohydrate kinase [Christensenella sp.]MEA5004102.1 FGGY-family carbohydrate kinase [Christensenella sp.]
MKNTECLLGIDMGTSSVKVGLFDLQGTPIAFADETYPLYTPKSGWAEQTVEEWWDAICKATRRLIDKSGVSPSAIMGMSVDTTCCTVMIADKDMNILRPAIMWMDVRASRQAKEITATGDPALKINGYGNVSAESMPAKALWIKQNEPELYDKAEHVFECVDWLMHKLTGELTASIDTTAPRWYYDRPNGGWPVSFYEKIGLADVLDKFPKEVLDLGTPVGGLTKKAAEDLGLVAGIPVGEGGADAFVGMVGLNVVAPGRIAMITGTSHLHLGLTEKEMHSEGMWGSYPDAVIRGLQMIEGGQTSTGAIVNWFKTNYCGNVEVEAKKQGKSIYDLLNEGAQNLPIGADGLLALDYFQGNRTPYADPDVRGMFYGLSLAHTPYHLYRAIIESICYGTEAIMQTFRDGGMRPDGIYISGGAVKSAFWTQTHADVCNLPIFIPKVTEAPCLGSAILGAVACGAYPDIKTAAKNMVTIEDCVEPDAGRHEQYKFYYEKYKEAYQVSKGWMHEVTTHSL